MHYKVGYVAGVFDMFHIGHLRLIERAKGCCDHLLVGIVDDPLVYTQKKKYPVVRLEERLAIVSALKYVDEAFPLVRGFSSQLEVWDKYQYNAMFSGDDHRTEPSWMAVERKLNACGADMVYFPYTKEVSTTFLQELTLPQQVKREDKIRKIEHIDSSYFIFPFDRIGMGERIIIYATGKVATDYYDQVSVTKYCFVTAFADSGAMSGDEFKGLRVLSPAELASAKNYDKIVIASTKYYNEIAQKLRSLKIDADVIV